MAAESLDYYEPSPELSRHVLTALCSGTGDVMLEDRHPIAPRQLVLVPGDGDGMTFGEQSNPAGQGAYAFRGFSPARPMRMHGPADPILHTMFPTKNLDRLMELWAIG